MTKVLIFGTFDGIHAGHRAFFDEARKHGDELVVALAPDNVVAELKGRAPKHDFATRVQHLENEDGVDAVVPGDKKISSWDVLQSVKPNVVVLGYDQALLREDLESHIKASGFNIEIVVAKPFEPEKYHSSIISSEQ